MARIAFIGLGIMGSPMADNLVKAGHTVTGYNLTQPPIDALVAAGGRGATGIAEAVADAEIVITMVPADPEVREGRSRARCQSWSAATRPTSPRRCRSSRRWARPSRTSVRTALGRPSRPP